MTSFPNELTLPWDRDPDGQQKALCISLCLKVRQLVFSPIPVFLKDIEGLVLFASVEKNILSCFARSPLFNFFSVIRENPEEREVFMNFGATFFGRVTKCYATQ